MDAWVLTPRDLSAASGVDRTPPAAVIGPWGGFFDELPILLDAGIPLASAGGLGAAASPGHIRDEAAVRSIMASG